jgi:hypothetical protein
MQDYPRGYGATLRLWNRKILHQDQNPGQGRSVEMRMGSNPISCSLYLIQTKLPVGRGQKNKKQI